MEITTIFIYLFSLFLYTLRGVTVSTGGCKPLSLGATPSEETKVIEMKKFKYAPKGILPLTEEQWEMLEKELEKPMTEKEKETWRRATEAFKKIKRVE